MPKSCAAVAGTWTAEAGWLAGPPVAQASGSEDWQAEIKDLYRLDDRALRDIGMTRLDVQVLARMRDPFKK